MEFLDEALVKIRRAQKEQAHASIETGIYFNNELLTFSRREYHELGISILLPESYAIMPSSMARVKYPSETRPELILTSMDTTVNFTFSLIEEDMQPEQLKETADYLAAVLRRINPANIFYEANEEILDDVRIDWFDYKSYAVDEAIYNIMFVVPVMGFILQGTFNCLFDDMEIWKSAMIQMIRSIKYLG